MDLGVMVNIYEDTEFTGAFEEAIAAGFTHGQVNSMLPKITPDEVRLLALAAHNEGFRVDAFGCYINPVRLNDPSLSEVTFADWKTCVENMAMMNGVERIVCWSGTLGKTIHTPNLLNQEEDTFNSLFISLHSMLEQVRGFPVQILLEPHAGHVLYDAHTCLRMAQKFPSGEVKIVLDAPNVVPPKEVPHPNGYIQDFVIEVAPAIGLVHLKDIDRNDDGHRKFAPPGKGKINYSPYLRVISQTIPEVPVIIDGVKSLGEMRNAREFVETLIRDANL